MQARLGDTDMHGHINNVAYLSFVEAAHHAYFRDLATVHPPSVRPFVAHTAIDYLEPALLTDDLVVDLGIGDIANTSLTLYFEVLSKGRDERVHAQGKVVIVYFDTSTRTKAPIGEELRAQVECEGEGASD